MVGSPQKLLYALVLNGLQLLLPGILAYLSTLTRTRRMSYTNALKKAQCERRIKTTIRKRRRLFAGAVQQTSSERLTHRVMFGTMAGGVNPGRGRPGKNWAQGLVDDIRVFEATEGSTNSSPLLFEVETVLWPRAAKNSGNWHRGIVDAADGFMTRWHRGEAEKSWQRLTAEDAKSSSNQGKPGGRGRGEQPY